MILRNNTKYLHSVKHMKSLLSCLRRFSSSTVLPTHYEEVSTRDRVLLRYLTDVAESSKTSNDPWFRKAQFLRDQLNTVFRQRLDLQAFQSGDDKEEFKLLIEEEFASLDAKVNSIEEQVKSLVLSDEFGDRNDVTLEIRAGVGGTEASQFSEELFRLYEQLSALFGWRFTQSVSDSATLSAEIHGEAVYRNLKLEAGVHRVQRVPATERTGRMHTSTAAIAVLPIPSEIDVVINPRDLVIQTFRSSGGGGMHHDHTESAVRVKHLPSGIVVERESTRSQIKNRKLAIDVLRARLYQQSFSEQLDRIRKERNLQVPSQDRSDKIRTYHAGRGTITDHRFGLTVKSRGISLLDATSFKSLLEKVNLAYRDSTFESVLQKYQ